MTYAIECVSDSYGAFQELEAGDVDVVITDPPYNAHVQGNLCSGSLVGTKNVPKYELDFAPQSAAGLDILARECPRVARRWSVIFSAVEDFGLYKMAAREAYVRGCIWYKCNAMGQLTADRPATAYEGITLLHSKAVKKAWNGRGSYGIWRCNGTRGTKDRHPNEKPLDLCLKLVALFSNRGETVFDPFCGSGAIGEACVRLGRNYVGWDSDRAWCDRARARLTVAAGYPEIADEQALGLCSMKGTDT
jgi:site-specific DNA-methyltransferase (adenine-specific)